MTNLVNENRIAFCVVVDSSKYFSSPLPLIFPDKRGFCVSEIISSVGQTVLAWMLRVPKCYS